MSKYFFLIIISNADKISGRITRETFLECVSTHRKLTKLRKTREARKMVWKRCIDVPVNPLVRTTLET